MVSPTPHPNPRIPQSELALSIQIAVANFDGSKSLSHSLPSSTSASALCFGGLRDSMRGKQKPNINSRQRNNVNAWMCVCVCLVLSVSVGLINDCPFEKKRTKKNLWLNDQTLFKLEMVTAEATTQVRVQPAKENLSSGWARPRRGRCALCHLEKDFAWVRHVWSGTPSKSLSLFQSDSLYVLSSLPKLSTQTIHTETLPTLLMPRLSCPPKNPSRCFGENSQNYPVWQKLPFAFPSVQGVDQLFCFAASDLKCKDDLPKLGEARVRLQ